jgi:hypothetical protein
MNFRQIYTKLENAKFPDSVAEEIIINKNIYLTSLDINTIMNKVSDKDYIAKLIIKEKGKHLDGLDIQEIYESDLIKVNDISQEIINNKKNYLTEKDLVYIINYDNNYDLLKNKLIKYFDKDFLSELIEEIEKSKKNNKLEKKMLDFISEGKLRKHIYNIIKENFIQKNAVVFIKGEGLSNGKKKLYATNINTKLNLDRLKKDNTEGSPAQMVNFTKREVFRVIEELGKLKLIKIAWNSNSSMLERLGLKSNNVNLNDNKTPIHWESVYFDNPYTAVNNLQILLMNIKDIEWF